MTHETLYKRSSTGKIQEYKIQVFGADNYARIEKQTGQLTGKKITHKEDIREGKNIGRSNETTPLQQAESQALSDWTRKLDEGYKTLSQLETLAKEKGIL